MSRPRGGELAAIAFIGGGTGGHLFPGIAVAERARERFPGSRAVFFRTGRAVEEQVFHGLGFETRGLEVRAPGKSVRGWMRFALEAERAQRQLEAELRGCDAVFGLGGYASFPGILAAKGLGVPVILLEQNLSPGKVTRLFAPFVSAVACAFEGTTLPFSSRGVFTGNPVRRAVIEAARWRAAGSRRPGPRTVLVVGGSQGSSAINQAIRQALPVLLELRERIQWIHVTGPADKDAMTEAYRTQGWTAKVHSFTPELPRLMAESDLVLGRAGGTTVSEIAVIGVPAVLIPYPHHRDDHQRLNAEALSRAGGALVLSEAELRPQSLRAVLQEVLFQPERLEAMSRGARRLARPEAADLILDLAMDTRRRCPLVSAFSC